jgi:LysM repeat protein/murein endopeptidase
MLASIGTLAAQTHAAPTQRVVSAASVGPQPADAILVDRDARSLGSMSVGHPHDGFLFNALRMPKSPLWTLSVPDHAWGTEETVANLIHCIGRVHQQFPGSPPAIIGSLSAEHGGLLPPHKSHRTGRDVDLYFYRLAGTKPWYKRATAQDLDRPRTWALLRAIITETDVEFVLIDRSVEVLIENYALAIGEDPEWIRDLFHDSSQYQRALVKHIPGHTAHMHVRFISPAARERGRHAYDRLVEQGHVQLPDRELVHEVVPGDSLTKIAARYSTTVEQIRALNQLEASLLFVGQKLRVREHREIRGAREGIHVPARRLPRTRPLAPIQVLAGNIDSVPAPRLEPPKAVGVDTSAPSNKVAPSRAKSTKTGTGMRAKKHQSPRRKLRPRASTKR